MYWILVIFFKFLFNVKLSTKLCCIYLMWPQSLIASSVAVTGSTVSHFLVFFPSIMLVVTRSSSLSILIKCRFAIYGTFASRFNILFLSYCAVCDSPYTVSYDFVVVHEIHSILIRNHFSIIFNFICSCFAVAQASHRTSVWVYHRALQGSFCVNESAFVCQNRFHSSEIHFLPVLLLMIFQCCFIHCFDIKVDKYLNASVYWLW